MKTYLSLLVEKGRLSARRVGNSFLYKPKTGMLQSLRQAADDLMEKMLGDSQGPLLAYMIKQSRFSADEIAELRRVLAEAEKNLRKEDRKP